jgi:3-hydroxyacyl-[acyl-carrier-protein] dehydratase
MSRMRQAIAGAAQGPVNFPEDGVAERKFLFGKDFLGFSGHFPGQPILPAVVQVLVAAGVAEALLGDSGVVQTVENAKFLLPIGPEVEVSVLCQRRKTSGPPAAEVRVLVQEGAAASFRLVFGEETEGR